MNQGIFRLPLQICYPLFSILLSAFRAWSVQTITTSSLSFTFQVSLAYEDFWQKIREKFNEVKVFISIFPSLPVCLELARSLNQINLLYKTLAFQVPVSAFLSPFRLTSTNIFPVTRTKVCGSCNIFYDFFISCLHLYK